MLQDTFVAPPYGLRKGVIPFYISLFDNSLEHAVNHYFDGEYVTELDGVHYDLLAKHPKLCVIQYTELSAVKKMFLAELSSIFKAKGEYSVNSIVQGIYSWRSKVPIYVKTSPKISTKGKKLLVFVDSAKEPDRLIFNKIPEAFGFETIVSDSSKQSVTKLLTEIKAESQTLLSIYPNLVRRLNVEMIETLSFLQQKCLGEKPQIYKSGDNLAKMYHETWSRFGDDIKNHPFSKNTQQFIQRFLSFDTTLHPQFFIETIADVMSNANPKHWDIKGESLFNFNLTKVRGEIEMTCEFLSDSFAGKTAIAFVNHKTGEKEFLRLGVQSEISDKDTLVKSRISDLLSEVHEKDRNNLLLSLLSSESDKVETIKKSKNMMFAEGASEHDYNV